MTSTLPTAASTTPSSASALQRYPSNSVDSSIATTGVATLVYDDGPAPTCFSSVRYAPKAATLPNTAR